MMAEVEALLERYLAWLKDKTKLRQVSDDWVEITTPYLDRHNDYLQIYTRREGTEYVLTDDGYTIEDLKLSGCALDTNKRQALLEMTLNGFGVHRSGDALEVRASLGTFALKKHALIQAVLAVNDLFYLATPLVASLFLEDVTTWLDAHEVRYTPQVKFAGKSGCDHVFHFVIPRSRTYPERIVRAINVPKKQTASELAWSWVDTREARPTDSRAYAFLNDTDRVVSPDVTGALASYDVTPVLWSEREAVRDHMAG